MEGPPPSTIVDTKGRRLPRSRTVTTHDSGKAETPLTSLPVPMETAPPLPEPIQETVQPDRSVPPAQITRTASRAPMDYLKPGIRGLGMQKSSSSYSAGWDLRLGMDPKALQPTLPSGTLTRRKHPEVRSR